MATKTQNELKISFSPLEIPLVTNFKHASCSRSMSSSIWVETNRGDQVGYGEGCPRPYVTGESIEGAIHWMRTMVEEVTEKCVDLSSLKKWVHDNEGMIDEHPAAWCAFELSLLDLFAKENKQSIEALLGRDEVDGSYTYTAVVGDGNKEKVSKYFMKYESLGFRDYKLKISGDLANDKMKLDLFKKIVDGKFSDSRLRIDANNLWKNNRQEASKHLKSLNFNLLGIEEPLEAKEYKNLSLLSEELKMPVILDESLCNLKDVDALSAFDTNWIGNVRVSKMGGLIRSLDMVSGLKKLGVRIIVGAQVGETSLLTRAALVIAKAAGDKLIGQEGAFGTHLLEFDYVEPVIMFGDGGVLTMNGSGQSDVGGFGLTKIKPEPNYVFNKSVGE